MALSAATIQTFITNLTATYETLSQEQAQSRSAAGRAIVTQNIETIQKQLEYWQRQLAHATGNSASFTIGRPTR